jgi:rhodanese-related sulfurtransferase
MGEKKMPTNHHSMNVKYITPEQLLESFGHRNQRILLDIREPEEFKHSHIPGSINIPLLTLNVSLAQLDKRKEFIMICLRGAKSPAATLLLIEAGFNAKNLVGGIRAWRGPLEKNS